MSPRPLRGNVPHALRAVVHLETLVVLMGAVVLLGWLFDIAALKSILPSFPSMKANTALAFVLAGSSVWLLRTRPQGRRARLVARVLAALVALVGVLTLCEYLFGWRVGIDQLLFRDGAGAVGTFSPGRMGAITATGLLAAGLSLLLLDVPRPRRLTPAQAGALLVATVALLALAGFLYEAPSRTGFSKHLTQMGLHTSLTFLVLAAAILLLRPRVGVMALLSSPGAGGVTMRRLLFPAVAIPLLLGWLRNEAQQAGYFETEVGLALMVVSMVLALSVVAWLTGRLLERVDTERREAFCAQAEALRNAEAAERMFRGIMESGPDAIVIAGADGRIALVNRQAEELLGYGREELLGQPVELLVPEPARPAHTSHRARYLSDPHVRPMGAGLDLEVVRKDGSIVPVEIGLGPVESDGELLVVSAIRDVTERKRIEAEILALNEELEGRVLERTVELRAANKELEAFSYSVSHDLRAPLRAIGGFSRILADEHAGVLSPEGLRHLGLVERNVGDMETLIDGLLRFSRLGRGALVIEPVDLESLARDTIDGLEVDRYGRDIELEVGPLPEVRGDPVLLRQVLSNLLTNALKFTRGRDRARIEIGSIRKGGPAVIFVRDNGVGFDMRHADKLFGVFQRLHRAEDYEGSGLGLALVARIVGRHGGRVWAESSPGEGATFYFTLAEGGTR